VRNPEGNHPASKEPAADIVEGPVSWTLARIPVPARATAAGLAIAFAVPFAAGAIIRIIASLGGELGGASIAILLVAAASEIAALIVVVRYGENRLLGSVGIRPPDTADLKIGLGFGLGFFLLAILIPSAVAMPASQACVALGLHLRVLSPGYELPAGRVPVLAGMLVVAVAAIAEELAMRGFVASRLRTLTGSALIGGAAALGLDLAAHLPLWGIRYAIAIAPVEALLVGLFLWKRRLLPCVVANFTLSALALILVAVAGTPAAAPPVRESAAPAPVAAASVAGTPKSQREQAIEKLRRALESKSSPADPFVKHALAYAKNGDYGKAEAEMSKAIAAEPGAPGLYVYRGDLYAAQNRHDMAIADYSRAISMAPDDAALFLRRANEYVTAGNDEPAHRDFSKAIDLNPKDPDAYVDRSALYFRENRYDEAVADVSEAIKLAPNDINLYQRRAKIYQYMHQYDRAIKDCDRVIALDSSLAQGYDCRATQEVVKGDLKRAIADLGEVLKRAPNLQAALVTRGDLEMQTKQWAAARADFVALSNANSVDPETSDWAAWALATSSHPELRDGQAAIRLATHACEGSGYRNTRYLETLAAAYAESGDFAQAVKWERRALGIARTSDPGDVSFEQFALKRYENRKPMRDDEYGPTPSHQALKTIAGAIIAILMLIGLMTIIVWIVKLANRRRRNRAATA
jgi:tetratricopeptide (TPR) repeat protein